MTTPRKPRKRKAQALDTPAAKVKAWLQARRRGKAEYSLSDQLLAELLEDVEVGEPIDIGRGGKWRIVDQFANTNTVFRSTPVNRFALESIP